MKQLTISKGQYFERLVRDGSGRLARATFFVYENGGHLKARLVSAVLINEKCLGNKTGLLCGAVAKNEFVFETLDCTPIVSSFVFLNTIYYSGSKPRAPTSKTF